MAMTPSILWFCFHPRDSLRDAVRKRQWTIFGHVEVMGQTPDGVFFAYDPRAFGTLLTLSTDPDAFFDGMAQRYVVCHSVIRFHPDGRGIRLPFHPTMNCASQCGHLAGLRAYSPRSLRRILIANGGVETQNDPEGRSRSTGSAPA